MEITIGRLARPADQDYTDIVPGAALTGEPRWVGENRLLIPFDRDLTPAEEAAVIRRLTTLDADDETAARDVDALRSNLAGLAQGIGPMTADQHTQAVRLLARVALLIIRRLRRAP